MIETEVLKFVLRDSVANTFEVIEVAQHVEYRLLGIGYMFDATFKLSHATQRGFYAIRPKRARRLA